MHDGRTGLGEFSRCLAQRTWARAQATPNPGEITASKLLAGVLAEFEADAVDFTCGAMVTDVTYWVPQWLSWENTTDTTYGSVATSNTNLIKIWFTDAAFVAQYSRRSLT